MARAGVSCRDLASVRNNARVLLIKTSYGHQELAARPGGLVYDQGLMTDDLVFSNRRTFQ